MDLIYTAPFTSSKHLHSPVPTHISGLVSYQRTFWRTDYRGFWLNPSVLGSEDKFLSQSQPPYHSAICRERLSSSLTYGNTTDDLRHPVKSPCLDSCHQIRALKRWSHLLRKANMFLKTSSFNGSFVFLKSTCLRQCEFELSVSECCSGQSFAVHSLATWGGFFHRCWTPKLFHPGVKLLLAQY